MRPVLFEIRFRVRALGDRGLQQSCFLFGGVLIVRAVISILEFILEPPDCAKQFATASKTASVSCLSVTG